jgi:hypothetical protein
MATSARKSIQLKVSVTPELHERLREVAAQLGQAPATCASMAVGEWVSARVRAMGAQERIEKGMLAELGPLVREQLEQGAAEQLKLAGSQP